MLKIGPDGKVQLTQAALVGLFLFAVSVGSWMTVITMQLADLKGKVDSLGTFNSNHTDNRRDTGSMTYPTLESPKG